MVYLRVGVKVIIMRISAMEEKQINTSRAADRHTNIQHKQRRIGKSLLAYWNQSCCWFKREKALVQHAQPVMIHQHVYVALDDDARPQQQAGLYTWLHTGLHTAQLLNAITLTDPLKCRPKFWQGI